MNYPGFQSGIFYLVMAIMIVFGNGCAVVSKDYAKFYQADPHSILIVPPLNNSPEVGADTYFLATVSLPLAERGYYVYPVNMSKDLLIDAGLNDAGLVHEANSARLGKLFGADAILYITIDSWEAKYMIISTTVTVGFTYVLKEASSGEVIWEHHQVMNYTPQNQNSGNLIADLIVAAAQAAITKAAPNYMPLARQANATAFNTVNQGIPEGPHNTYYWKNSKTSK